MKKPPILFLLFISIFLFQDNCFAVSSADEIKIVKKEKAKKRFYTKGVGKKRERSFLKGISAFFKFKKTDPVQEGKKRGLPLGVIALLCVTVGFLGLLFSPAIGNFIIYLGWLAALILGIQGMNKDQNKFPALLALAIVAVLFASTLNFVDVGFSLF